MQGLIYRSGLQPVAQLDGSGGISAQFVYASGRNVPDYALRGGTLYRIITDHLGSLRLVVDTSDGSIMQRMDYDAWGRVTVDEKASGWEPPWCSGSRAGSTTRIPSWFGLGLGIMMRRWVGGRPRIRSCSGGGDSNLFAYVGGDPVGRIDPSGLEVEMCYERPNIPFGWLLELLGFNHVWLKTKSREGGLEPIYGRGTGVLGIGAEVYVGNDEGRYNEPGAPLRAC